nr:MAG TPA: hypothetical protein [Caudoviricetes sp.]
MIPQDTPPCEYPRFGQQATRNMSYPVLPRSLLVLVILNPENRVLVRVVEKSDLEVRVAAHASDIDDGIGSRHTADDVVKPGRVLHRNAPVISEDIVLHVVRELDMLLMALSPILLFGDLVGLEVLSIHRTLGYFLLVGIFHRSRRVVHSNARYHRLRIGFAILWIRAISHSLFVLRFSNFCKLLVDLNCGFLEVLLELASKNEIYAKAASDSSGCEICDLLEHDTSDLVVHHAVDIEVQRPLGDSTTVLVLTLEGALEDVEVDEVVSVTLDPTSHSTSGSVGESEHLVDLVEEDVPTSLQNIIRVLLLALEVQHRQVLVRGPVDVSVIEDNAIGRDSVDSSNRLEGQLVVSDLVLGVGDEGVDHSVLAELSLDLLLVGLEGLVDSGVRCSERGIPLEHDAVTGDQRGDRGGTENKGGGIKLRQLGRHSGVEDDLVPCGVLVSELAVLVGLVDLDEKGGLLSQSLLNLEGCLGGENRGTDEANRTSGGQNSGGVLAENQSCASSEAGDNSEIHLIRPAFLSRR